MRTNATEPSNLSMVAAQVLPGGAETTRNADAEAGVRAFDSQVAALLRRVKPANSASEPRAEPLPFEKRKARRRDGEEAGNGLGIQWGTLVTDKTKVDIAERSAKELRTRGEPRESPEGEAQQKLEGKSRGRVSGQDQETGSESATTRGAQTRESHDRGGPVQHASGMHAAQHAGVQTAAKASEGQKMGATPVQGVKQAGATVGVETRVAVNGQQQSARAGEKSQSNSVAVGGLGGTGKGGRADAFKQLLQAAQPTRHAVEQQQVAQSALKAMGMALKEGGGEVTMKLAPEALGQVKVKLVVQDAGVDAMFTASTASARQLLEGSTDTLREALEARGLRVDSIIVDGPRTDAQAGPQSSRDGAQDARRDASQNGQGGALTSATDGRSSDEPGGGSQRHERGDAVEDARSADAEVVANSDAVWDIAPAVHVTAMGVEWVA